MTTANRDPHGHGYVFVPRNRILSVFHSGDDVREALRDLHALGFDDAHLDVFIGAEGADVLDLSGEAHGVIARVMRNIEALLEPEDARTSHDADAALRAGGAAVAIRMDGRESLKDRVREILKARHGTFTRYIRRWTIESLD